MAPEWFDVASLSLGQMWDDEAYWLAREMLAGVITCDRALPGSG